ncbi:538_t:CDS:2, partial [Paraglomus occultum]
MSSRRRDRSRSVSPRHKDPREEDSSRKDKKHKRSHRRRSKDSDLIEQAKKFLQPITEDDYYTKSTEFRIWLREYKDKYFDELNSEQTRRYFKKFVNAWNKFELEKKYYDGIRSSQIDKSDKTRYKWNIKANADELEAIKNT